MPEPIYLRVEEHLANFDAKFSLSSHLNTSKTRMHSEPGLACNPLLFETPLAYQPDHGSL